METVRFYEREGLMSEPPRRPSGYRDYPPEAVTRIGFIRRAKDLGFTLKEIKQLLSLRATTGARCADVQRRAEEKIDEMDRKIRGLRAMRSALSTLLKECTGAVPVSRCPILNALDADA